MNHFRKVVTDVRSFIIKSKHNPLDIDDTNLRLYIMFEVHLGMAVIHK